MKKFVVVEFQIYRSGREEQRRWFRPNIPAIERAERWVHCKLYHDNPDALVTARPPRLSVGNLLIGTSYSPGWAYNGDLGVWIFTAGASEEEEMADLSLDAWAAGRFRGEYGNPYR